MKSFKKIFTLPVYEDEVESRQAYLLHIIVWTLICIPIPFVIYTVTLTHENVFRTLMQAAFGEGINIILLVMLHRKYVRAASILQVSAFWLFFTTTAVTGAGVKSEAYLLGYGLVITIAGILLGRTGTLIFAFLSLLAGAFMVYAQAQGILVPGIIETHLTTWVVSLVLFPVGAVLQYLASRTVKTALDRARASEEKYRLISQVSSDYTFATEIHKDGSISLIWVAGAFEKITGYTFEEYTASGGWLAHVHPDDLEKDAQDMEKLRKNQNVKSEIRTFTKNGEIRWEQFFAHPVWDENENRLIGIIGAVQDITEQKQTETELAHERDLLQIFMNNIPDTVYFKDTESRFIRINRAQAQMLGINNDQDAIGKTDLDFQNSELAQKFIAEEKQIIETGQPVLNRIEFNPTPDGMPRWFSATKVAVKNRSGRAIGIIGISRDVTEQKKSEEFEQSRRSMLEKVIKLGQHVTEVHDLRTTLIRIWNGIHDDLGFDRVGLFLYNPVRKSMDGAFGTNNQGEMADEWHTWFSLKEHNQDSKPFLQALEQPDTVFFTHSYQDDYHVSEGHNMSGVKDHALIGAWSGEKPVAIISVDHVITGRPITDTQLEALRLFAGYAGLAIENARLNTALQNELSQRTETLLHQSAILNGIPDMAWLKDKNSRYVAVNEQFATAAGMKIEEIVGKTDFEIWHKSFAEKYRNDDLNVMQSRQRTNAEEIQIDNMGREYWVETTKTPILNASGEVIGTTGIAREITERKKMQAVEQQRRAILEKVIKLGQRVTEVYDLRTTLIRIWHGVHDDLEFDRLGIYLYNPERLSMDGTFGTNDQGKMTDEWHTWVSIEQDNSESKSFLRVLEKPDTIYLTHTYENDYKIPEDHIMSGVEDFAAIAAWAGVKPVAVICVDHQITKRPITEEQLEALRLFAGYAGLAIENARLNSALQSELSQRKNFIVELEAKNAELERFTYTVSHDLKSPLVTIKGFLGYIEQDAQAGDFAKFKHDKQRIEKAVEKMQNLLKDLLELSRIGRLMNAPLKIPFNEIVTDALEILDGQIKEKNVLIEYQNNHVVINCDRVRMTEVLQNLIDNAIKFMGNQPNPRIEIDTFINDRNETVLFVKDNGIGVAPEFQENIFGLFNKLAVDSEGTGIGLALVKRIIEVHGGRIWVESQVGRGTTFYFTLP